MLVSRAIGALRELDRALFLLAAIALIAQIGISIMLPLLPLYAVQLGASPAVLGLLTSAFAVTAAIGQLVSGFAAERVSARRQIPLGSAFYAASNALIATATAAIPLVAYRAIAGLGGGVMLIAERLYITRITPVHRLAFANGVLSAAGSLGSVVGPIVGGTLAGLDLRIPFIVVAVTSGTAAVASLWLPAPRDDAPFAGDAAPAGAPEAEAQPTRRAQLGVLLPLLLVNLGLNGGYGAWITTYGTLVTTRFGWSATDVVLVFAGFGVGTILLGPWLSRQADLRGRRALAAVGLSIVLGWAVLLLVGVPREIVLLTSILAGGGLTVAQSSWFAMLGEATGGGRRSRSFGLVAALSNLGIVAGAVASSAAWQAFDVQVGLATSLGFIGLGLAALLLVRRAAPPPAPAAPGLAARAA